MSDSKQSAIVGALFPLIVDGKLWSCLKTLNGEFMPVFGPFELPPGWPQPATVFSDSADSIDKSLKEGAMKEAVAEYEALLSEKNHQLQQRDEALSAIRKLHEVQMERIELLQATLEALVATSTRMAAELADVSYLHKSYGKAKQEFILTLDRAQNLINRYKGLA